MKYNIEITLEVDDEAPWLEIGDTDNCTIVEDLFKDLIYDIDDVTLGHISVELTT